MNKRRTFTILGVRYNAPASLDENIREWFAHNAPTADCDTTPADFDRTVATLKERGMVAHHDTDRTFCIIHLASGDHDGQHPERHITITQSNHMQIIEELKDTMAQAVVWYKTNIIELIKCM